MSFSRKKNQNHSVQISMEILGGWAKNWKKGEFPGGKVQCGQVLNTVSP